MRTCCFSTTTRPTAPAQFLDELATEKPSPAGDPSTGKTGDRQRTRRRHHLGLRARLHAAGDDGLRLHPFAQRRAATARGAGGVRGRGRLPLDASRQPGGMERLTGSFSPAWATFSRASCCKMPYDATGAFRVYDLSRIPRHIFTRVAAADTPSFSRAFPVDTKRLQSCARSRFRCRSGPTVIPRCGLPMREQRGKDREAVLMPRFSTRSNSACPSRSRN